ncbi:hypothetical protein GCM10007984_25690 [Shewanella putrefaciens]|nr:hypothetical protein GCM10007984_25690 [Shewanella putrefaciens]
MAKFHVLSLSYYYVQRWAFNNALEANFKSDNDSHKLAEFDRKFSNVNREKF